MARKPTTLNFTVVCDNRVNSRQPTRQAAISECGRLGRSMVGHLITAFEGETQIAEAYFTRSMSGGVYGEIRETKPYGDAA